MNMDVRKHMAEKACHDIQVELDAIPASTDPEIAKAKVCGMITLAADLGLLPSWQSSLFYHYAEQYRREGQPARRAA